MGGDYDTENRLTTVSGATNASFTHDGDGNRVKSVPNGVTTYSIGNHFEWTGDTSTMVKYDYAGGQRIAMRKGSSTLYFLLGDHLGSTSLTANSSGSKIAELRYYPWGGTRYTYQTTPTSYQFTGQRNDAATYPAFGLYFYNARYYDSALGRFIQADSIVPGAASSSGGGAATLGYDSNTRLTPLTVNLGEFAAQVNAENREVLEFGAFFQWDSKTRQEHNVPMGPANPQALNRYAYCLNNPLRYVDPTGHDAGTWTFTIESWNTSSVRLDKRIHQLERKAGIMAGVAGAVGGGVATAIAEFGTGGLATPVAAVIFAVAGGTCGLIGYEIGGGAEAYALQMMLDNINVAVGELQELGVTEFSIFMTDYGKGAMEIWYNLPNETPNRVVPLGNHRYRISSETHLSKRQIHEAWAIFNDSE